MNRFNNLKSGIIVLIPLIILSVLRIFNGINFNRECEGYLVRASNSNTIPLAEKELGIALEYIEKNSLTNGYTSIVYKTPDEDIGFWYENLKAAHKELKSLEDKEIDMLTASNQLIKLRETLSHSSEGKTIIIAPNGISIYPYNFIYGFWFCLFGSLFGAWLLNSLYHEDFIEFRKNWRKNW